MRSADLPALLDDVLVAKARERDQLHGSGSSTDNVRLARQATLLALTAYADAIGARSWPVPRSIRLDIQMHLCEGSTPVRRVSGLPSSRR
jgi:hypothetical protein